MLAFIPSTTSSGTFSIKLTWKKPQSWQAMWRRASSSPSPSCSLQKSTTGISASPPSEATGSSASVGRRYLGGTWSMPMAATMACTLGTGRD
ncbi:Os01g0352200, partial [Oryza sativa Japonica Group]